jgi:hypothetical protein
MTYYTSNSNYEVVKDSSSERACCGRRNNGYACSGCPMG